MRRRLDISAEELGALVGRQGRSAVERWEDGKIPDEDVFPGLAAAIGIPLEALLELAGRSGGAMPKADPVLVALADQAADMERRLRALATAPRPAATTTEERAAAADALEKAIGDRKGGGSAAKKKRRSR